jgi:1-deoxy-D-xylulose-5-phosphate synthase
VPVRVLERVLSPADLKSLSRDELKALCQEIRDYIVDVVSQKGGHLGPSLGVVELTVALETVLDLPRDKVVWDTGHPGLRAQGADRTARRPLVHPARRTASRLPEAEESPYDAFGAGHASTAISAALGLATARDLARHDHRVVAIIGDGAMTGGLAYEALNNAGQSHRRLLVILNDNGMSISPNVGAMAHYLTSLTASPQLKRLRDEAKHLIERLPVVSESVGELAKRLESTLKSLVIPGGIFQALGFSYLGRWTGTTSTA